MKAPVRAVARDQSHFANSSGEFGSYCNPPALIAARVFDHGLLEQMAAVNAAPVLNMLSGSDHPLQALADLLTIRQLLGGLDGARVAFIGEGNNVARSLAQACTLMGAEFILAGPEGYGLQGATCVTGPAEAVEGAHVVYTDVWVSMGGEDSAERRTAFTPYQVNEELMALAPNAWFMHCLPAGRGEEVTAGVIDGPQSAIWRQAENRMHTARGAMLWMMGCTPELGKSDGEQENESGAGLFGRARHVDHPEMAADRI